MEDKKKKKRRTHLLIQTCLNTQPYLFNPSTVIEVILAENKKTIFLFSRRIESQITFSQFLFKKYTFIHS